MIDGMFNLLLPFSINGSYKITLLQNRNLRCTAPLTTQQTVTKCKHNVQSIIFISAVGYRIKHGFRQQEMPTVCMVHKIHTDHEPIHSWPQIAR